MRDYVLNLLGEYCRAISKEKVLVAELTSLDKIDVEAVFAVLGEERHLSQLDEFERDLLRENWGGDKILYLCKRRLEAERELSELQVQKQLIDSALDGLPPIWAAAVRDYYIEGKSIFQLVSDLHCSERTITRYLKCGVDELGRILITDYRRYVIPLYQENFLQ